MACTRSCAAASSCLRCSRLLLTDAASFQTAHGLLLLLELPRIQMLLAAPGSCSTPRCTSKPQFCRCRGNSVCSFFRLSRVYRVLALQLAIRRHRNMQKVHVRRFFIHMHHCGDDIFRPHKFCEKGFAFLKKAAGVLRGKLLKESTVRGHNKAAHMNSIFTHRFHQQEVVNTVLNSLGILCLLAVQVVIALAFAVINIRLEWLSCSRLLWLWIPPEPLELVHVQHQKRHGYCPCVAICAEDEQGFGLGLARELAEHPASAAASFPAFRIASALVVSPTSFGASMAPIKPLLALWISCRPAREPKCCTPRRL